MANQASSISPAKAGAKPITFVLIIAFILLNCLMAFWFASPYFAVNDLKAAAATGDIAKLKAMVDTEAVRGSVKSQLEDPEIIDMAVSPGGLSNLFACSNLVSGNGAITGSPSNVDAATGMQTVGVTPEAEPNSVSSNDYETLDQFCASFSQKYSGQGVKFILKRSGLFGWKLVALGFQSSPVVHTPVYFVGYSTAQPPDGIRDVQPFDRLLAVNEQPVVDYQSVVQQFQKAGNSATVAVLRDGQLVRYNVSRSNGGKFGFNLSSKVFSPKPEVLATPAALEKKDLLVLMQQQDPAAAAALVQQGAMVLLQPGFQVLEASTIQVPVGNNQGVLVMSGRLLDGRATTGANGLPGRNFWMLRTNFPDPEPVAQ